MAIRDGEPPHPQEPQPKGNPMPLDTATKYHADTTTRLAVKLSAPNDENGNPRRGWMIFDSRGEYLGFVDEGHAALRQAGAVVELHTVPTTAAFYRACKAMPYAIA
ncbi:hypothetical protein [Dactylosporangium darangshiense]|uniref:Uncharacterized protein n=1 Tax=Dactylosporangium darangshiense TaxID=579108 RepID=A0ABP8DHY3_9ACTN